MKFCHNCGAQLPNGTKFCTSCGTKQELQPAPAPVAEPAPAPVYTAPVAEPAPAPVYTAPAAEPAPAPVYTAPVEEPAPAPVYAAPVEEPVPAPVYAAPVEEPAPAPEMPAAEAKPAKAPKAPKTPKAPKEKKPMGKKPFIFGGIAVAVIAVAVLLVVFLGGRGGVAADDPVLGVYEAISCTVDGEELKAKEFKDDYIELKTRGKATVSILGEEFDAKWSLDGKDFLLVNNGDEFEGTLKKGVLTLDFGDMEYVFQQTESDNEDGEEAENKEDKEDNEEEAEPVPDELGCWVLLRSDSEDESLVMNEENVKVLEDMGIYTYVEFYEDGSGFISVMGEEEFEFTWADGVATAEGEDISYSLEGEELHMDFDGMVLVFVRGEKPVPNDNAAQPEDPETPEEPEAPAQPQPSDNPYDWWEGDWYGWWVVWNGYGELSDYTDVCWDAYARIEVDGSYGTVYLWDEDGSADMLIANVGVSFTYGLNPCGTMVSEEGLFMDDPIEHADWNVDPGAANTRIYENMITIEGVYTDPENPENEMEYMVFLRPWGTDWEDVRNSDTSAQYYDDMMPPRYDDWYKPLINRGAAMPVSYEEGIGILSGAAGGAAAQAPAAGGTVSEGIIAEGGGDGNHVAIVGAEAFTDSNGQNAIRIYYDYTNNTGGTTFAGSELEITATQGGAELAGTYADYDKMAAEDDNDYLYVRDGITVRCVAEFALASDNGEVTVVVANWWGDNAYITVAFDLADLPGRPAGAFVPAAVAAPGWTVGLPNEGDVDTAHVRIDSAALGTDHDGNQVIVIYLTYTNNGTENTTAWLDTVITGYQDGIELHSGVPTVSVPELDSYYADVAPGQTVSVAVCYTLRGSSPVELEIGDGWNASAGCVFDLTDVG